MPKYQLSMVIHIRKTSDGIDFTSLEESFQKAKRILEEDGIEVFVDSSFASDLGKKEV